MKIEPKDVIKEIDDYLTEAEDRPWGNFEVLLMNAKDIIESQTKPLRFPTELRRMWTGAEVQEWIDKNQGIK